MMNKLNGFMVFWMEQWSENDSLTPCAKFFQNGDMTSALALMEELRKHPENQFVTMASQNSNSVGKPGVAAVENGKTPDGHDYDWSKAGRAGKTKRSRLAPELKVKSAETAAPPIITDWIEP